MSELANNKEGDVLYLTLNKLDDQKDIDQDIEMNNAINGKRGKKCKRDKKDKKDKKFKKEKFKKGKKCKKDKETKRLEKNGKLTNKIAKLIDITQQKQAYHINEAQLFGKQLTDLQNLLIDAPGMDFKDLKKSLIQIIKKTKQERKKDKKKEKREKKGRKKFGNMDEKKKEKMQARKEKREKKLERKKAKMERKQKKLENKKIMENARIESLPEKMEEKECLEIYIDGYNIIGCDKICRQNMRGKVYKARERLLELVYAFFQERNLNIGYQLIMHVWFDKNGKDFKYNNAVNVVFSGKESVDDRWVDMFGKYDKLNNKLVITSDRELTVRLGNLGMKCMKSGAFYKKYLNIEDGKKIKKETNDEVVNMVIDGDAYEPDGDIETFRMADMNANNNDKSSTSASDDDDDDELDEDEGDENNIDDEFDIIEMELEGMDSQPGAYPSPK